MSKKSREDHVKELGEEIDILDHMLSTLVDALEEKGILTQEEYERRIKEEIEKTAITYRDLESKWS